jgi:hypothetical protein
MAPGHRGTGYGRRPAPLPCRLEPSAARLARWSRFDVIAQPCLRQTSRAMRRESTGAGARGDMRAPGQPLEADQQPRAKR